MCQQKLNNLVYIAIERSNAALFSKRLTPEKQSFPWIKVHCIQCCEIISDDQYCEPQFKHLKKRMG